MKVENLTTHLKKYLLEGLREYKNSDIIIITLEKLSDELFTCRRSIKPKKTCFRFRGEYG